MTAPGARTSPSRAALVIPAYQPDAALLGVVLGTAERLPDLDIVVVDDGSTEAVSRRALAQVARVPGVHLLRHARNRGKGAALRTGIAFALESFPAAEIIVTADADGQHLPHDIARIVQAADWTLPRTSLLLGVRDLPHAGTPLRSWLGNGLTRLLFAAFAGQFVADTQTGLRALPRALAAASLDIGADGYAFEFEMLFRARRLGRIAQLPIAGIYLDGNSGSHFNPLRDSLRIYAVFLRQSALGRIFAPAGRRRAIPVAPEPGFARDAGLP